MRLAASGLLLVLSACASQDVVGPRSDVASCAAELERVMVQELEAKGIPALSIALVDDQETVWARGFGCSDPETQAPATARTVHRVGSVSKLFTDIALLQLVERGEVDLDAPLSTYLPELRPSNPFAKAMTLRQLLCHRAGLVREPPIGHYFDDNGPTLAASVESLNRTALVYEPGTRTKYSNAGIAVVGRVIERLRGASFAAYMDRRILAPMGLGESSFRLTPEVERRLARAWMWTLDGRTFPAPTFELGTSPAGNLYSSVADQARFLSVLFAGGQGPGGRVLRPETLEAMWKPQLAPEGAKSGFGLGFFVAELDGRRRVGHDGAVYGFATSLAALPDSKLGVVVVATLDVANSVTSRIANHALRCLLAVKESKPLPSYRPSEPLDPGLARRLEGAYALGDERLEVEERDGRLFLWRGGHLVEVRRREDGLVTDGRLGNGTRLVASGDGQKLEVDGKVFQREPERRPDPPPEKWRGLIGEYGWDHDVLYVLEHRGKLHVLIEWFDLYPLEELSDDVFAFPEWGLYHGEKLLFRRGRDGAADQVEAASVVFRRRRVGAEDGGTFRIEPRYPVAELRRRARNARPPRETGAFRPPELVDVTTVAPAIRLDVRYATKQNFLSTVFYPEPRAFLQRPAAEALARVQERLSEQGYGLLVHDAYRPWHVTKMFWDATPAEYKVFVADPAKGSKHNRGCAVDLTLCDLSSGEPVDMVSGYDEFSPRAFPHYPGGTSLERWHRKLLRRAMEAEGFTVYEHEWWHFDYKDWKEYPVLDVSFEEMRRRS